MVDIGQASESIVWELSSPGELAWCRHHCHHLPETKGLAKRKKYLKEIPDIALAPENNARQGFFEREEFERVVRFLPEYFADVARFAYCTGWRIMEILTLEWRDIEGEVIRLRPKVAKNKEGRVLLLVGDIAAIIERQRQRRKDLVPYVFHSDGKPIKHYDWVWHRAREKAGVPHRLVHDIRRTVARNMDRAGVPRQVAKQIMGHKTDTMYNRYRIVNETDIREGLEKAQAYLGQETPKIVQFRTPRAQKKRVTG